MNYHHAFHAGNHTEVFKHAALVRLLMRLKQKPKPLAFIDTHAGLGVTNLRGEQALRTGEAQQGILKIASKHCPTAQPYIDIVRSYNQENLTRYPGSTAIARAMLSVNDRIIACELRDSAARNLKLLFGGDTTVSIHHRDGYEAMQALIPPKERRGAVFIDPPFEDKDEMRKLSSALVNGFKKWPTGVFVAWYPIKDPFAGRPLISALLSANVARLLSVEFVPFPSTANRLAGSGLLLCNAPWQFEDEMRNLCSELIIALDAKDGRWSVARPGA